MLSIEIWIFSAAYGNNFSSCQNKFRVCTRQISYRHTSAAQSLPLTLLGVETDILRLSQSCTLSLSLSRFKCMEFEFVGNFFFTFQSTMLPAGWPRNRDSFLAGTRDFSPLLNIQTSSGVHTASYPVNTGSSFPVGKTAGAWNSPLSLTDVKNTTTSLHAPTAWCFDNAQGQIFFLFR
jgi:hypothetical protein